MFMIDLFGLFLSVIMLCVSGIGVENYLYRPDDINVRMQTLIRDKMYMKVLALKKQIEFSYTRENL